MSDLIKAIEEIWNHPERMEAREKLLAEMEEQGKIERIDDVLLLVAKRIDLDESVRYL